MADDKALQKLIKEAIKEGGKKVRRLDGNLHATGLIGVLPCRVSISMELALLEESW